MRRRSQPAALAAWACCQLFLSALPACESVAALCSSPILFGRPDAHTGLTEAQCQPRCDCGDTSFVAPAYGEADANALLAWTLLDPIAPVLTDPYTSAAPPAPPGDEICAVTPAADGGLRYHLATFGDETMARAAGATPTHTGACGACSALDDLAVYMRYPDLTTPVRKCGVDNLGAPMSDHLACLQALGFSLPCAQIWYWNTVHTRNVCALTCFALIDAPYQNPDGSLNACLQCDEDESGPVFKAVAGRTRRNTGIASALCRPCSELHPLVHDYRPAQPAAP